MARWRIYMQRNWRMLSRLGAGIALALAALLIALPRASADAGHHDTTLTPAQMLLMPHRFSSVTFAVMTGPDTKTLPLG